MADLFSLVPGLTQAQWNPSIAEDRAGVAPVLCTECKVARVRANARRVVAPAPPSDPVRLFGHLMTHGEHFQEAEAERLMTAAGGLGRALPAVFLMLRAEIARPGSPLPGAGVRGEVLPGYGWCLAWATGDDGWNSVTASWVTHWLADTGYTLAPRTSESGRVFRRRSTVYVAGEQPSLSRLRVHLGRVPAVNWQQMAD